MKLKEIDSKKKYLYDAYLRIFNEIIGVCFFFLYLYHPDFIHNKAFNIILGLIWIIFFLSTCELIIVHGYIISIISLALYHIVRKIVMSHFDPHSASYGDTVFIYDILVLSVIQIPLLIEDYIKFKKEDKK